MPILKYTIKAEADKQSFADAGRQGQQEMSKARGGGSASTDKETQSIKKQNKALRELRREFSSYNRLIEARFRLGQITEEQYRKEINTIEKEARAQGAFNIKLREGRNNLKAMANAQTRAQSGFKGISPVVGRANQVLFDFNQGLADVPYGMRGVGNNIPFVIRGFQQFAKAAREEGVSPIKSFIQAMVSPTGLIGIAAAVIPTFIILGDKLHWFGNEAKEAEKKAKEFADTLNSIVGSNINNFADSSDAIAKNISRINGALGLLDKKYGSLRSRQEGIQSVLRNNNKLTDEQRLLLGQQLEQISGQLNKENEIDKITRKKLKEKLAELKAEQLVNQAVGDILTKEEDRLRVGKQNNYVLLTSKQIRRDILGLEQDITDQLDEQQKKRMQKFTNNRVSEANALGEVAYRTALANARGFEKKRLKLTKERIDTEQQLRDAGVADWLAKEKAQMLYHARMQELMTEKDKEEAKKRKSIAQDLSRSRIRVQQLTLNAISTLSQAFANDNKAVAIGLLAVEKGLAIAQTIKEGIEKAGRAQMLASYYMAQSITPLGPNPFAIAAAANAQAQVAAIKGTTAATVAAIVATGIGEGANIINRGSRSSGTGVSGSAGVSGYSGQQQGFNTSDYRQPGVGSVTNFSSNGQERPIYVTLSGEFDDRVVSVKAERGRKMRNKGAIRA